MSTSFILLYQGLRELYRDILHEGVLQCFLTNKVTSCSFYTVILLRTGTFCMRVYLNVPTNKVPSGPF